MNLKLVVPLFCFLILNACSTEKQPIDNQIPQLTLGVMCGTVQFSDGCGMETDSLIKFGLALIHHMTYEDAESVFDQVIKKDPDCFWGHWGKAMTYIHPLWPDVPSDERMTKGWVLAQTALSLAQKEKEKFYGNALAAYYENGKTKTEPERLQAYENAWQKAREQNPDDLEARLFHLLTRLSNLDPSDKSYAVQLQVGAEAEKVLEEIPDHPGGFHYAIHAYDYPPIAHNAVRVARNYSKIAPEIPHALHMPTHIFTRLGHWQESIDWNQRSAKAAWNLPANGAISLHYLHALDYMAYAHLQQAEDVKAKEIMQTIDTLTNKLQVHAGTAYALAAIPGRIAIENKQWAEAAKIEVPKSESFPWNKFPQFEALIHFAKGVGAARSGQPEIGQQAIDRLEALKTAMGTSAAARYWVNQIEIQKTAVSAWKAFAEQNQEQALELMQKAAELEDATEKSPITPGELVPVREMFGDLLLELDRPSEALSQYQQSLERNPNRFNTVYNAGKAAELAGNTEKAKTYFENLLQLKGKSASDRPQLEYAAKFVSPS